MRILYVGNSGGMENIDRFYLFPPRIINGLIRNNHQVQVFNDKDVARLCNVFRSSRLGIKKTNQCPAYERFARFVFLFGTASAALIMPEASNPPN